MRYSVTHSCIACGMCADTCPEVFSMTAEHRAQALSGDVPPECMERAAQARDDCPVGAIKQGGQAAARRL